jgi:hypothetical protein
VHVSKIRFVSGADFSRAEKVRERKEFKRARENWISALTRWLAIPRSRANLLHSNPEEF